MDRLLVSLKYGSVEIVNRDRNLTQASKPPLIRGDRISCTLWKSSHPCVLGLSLDGWSKTLLTLLLLLTLAAISIGYTGSQEVVEPSRENFNAGDVTVHEL